MSQVIVYPGAKNPTHEISLSDGVQTWGLRLDGGPEAVKETPVTPSTLQVSNGGEKFGDWEPGMSYIEQRTWEGRRGQADFVDDNTRFFDSKMAWTLTPGKVFPVPNWKFSDPNGFYSEGYQSLPGNMSWRTLGGSYRNLAEPVTHSSGWATYDSVWLWVRRVGTPSAGLAVQVWANTLGFPDPLVVKAQGIVAVEDIPENESVLVKVDVSSWSALTGTESYLVIFGQLNDNAANHWEIGIDASGTSALYGDGAGWTGSGEFSIYYRMLSTGEDRQWRMFEFQGALYAVDQPADGTASKLLINGDRGKATSANASAIRDADKSWLADQWNNAWVKITRGTGAGQRRLITDVNDGTQALVVSPDWTVTPDTTSEYVIYHTPIWTEITSTGIGKPVTDVRVIDDLAYFCQGQLGAYLRKMRWNPSASPPAHGFVANGTVEADLVTGMSTNDRDVQVFIVQKDAATVQYGAPQTWSAATYFWNNIRVGDTSLPINRLLAHGGKLYAFKPDGRYKIKIFETVFDNGVATGGAAGTLTDTAKTWVTNAHKGRLVKIISGAGEKQIRKIDSNTATVLTLSSNWTTTPDATSAYQIFEDDSHAVKTLGETGFIHSENNGEAALSHGLDAYFSWGGYALQRIHGSSGDYKLSSIGPDMDEGLPDERRGRIVDLLGTPHGILAAVQGDGFSSVLALPNEGIGWHEVFRGWASGAKIDHIYFQDSYRPRLWISIGGELAYQDWPRYSFNPLKDAGISYHHEAILVSSTIDMGVSSLTKFIESITATVENLSSGVEVALDYQTNQNIGTNRWIETGAFQINPRDTLNINQGEVFRIRFRLRLRTNDEHTPPVVLATVLEGFARTPVKYRWELRVTVSDTLLSKSGVGCEPDPNAFLEWLKQAAVSSKRIAMRSIWEQLDNRNVIVEPPALLRKFTNEVTGFWGGQVQVSLREI